MIRMTGGFLRSKQRKCHRPVFLFLFLPWKMGFRSAQAGIWFLGMGQKWQKWEWGKPFLTLTSRDFTYFAGPRNARKFVKHLV